jgi:regulator of sirC expression with transglutaminase-like and TPR domain
VRDARQLFAAAVNRSDGTVDLATSALLIARLEYPALEPKPYLRRLDDMARTIHSRLDEGADPQTRLAALCVYLFEEEGFRGNNEEYYDPRNSFLNDVLDRRVGIPITLSTVFIEVGQRTGLEVSGVGLPGHFIVRVHDDQGDVLVDPFHGGALLTEDDCQKRLDRISGGKMKLRAQHLAPCSRRQMLARMLSNLKGIYVKSGDHLRAIGVMDLLLSVTADPEQVRDRGLLYASLDCYALAAADLASYLERTPSAGDSDTVRGTLEEMRARAARVN